VAHNQQVGVYQKGTDGVNPNPLQQPYNAGIPGSANPTLGSKDHHKGFYCILWFVVFWVSIKFVVDFLWVVGLKVVIYPLFPLLPIDLLVVIFAYKTIKGFQKKDVSALRRGNVIFIWAIAATILIAILWVYFFLEFVLFDYYTSTWFWIPFMLSYVTAIALAYISGNCEHVARQFESTGPWSVQGHESPSLMEFGVIIKKE